MTQFDVSDLFRSGLVQAVAAMDQYFHGVILDRSVDILLGRIPTSGAHRTIALPFVSVRDILLAHNEIDRELEARKHISNRLKKETFQTADE